MKKWLISILLFIFMSINFKAFYQEQIITLRPGRLQSIDATIRTDCPDFNQGTKDNISIEIIDL